MKNQGNIGKAIIMITQLAINMLVPIFLCLFIGMKLDQFFGTQWIVLICILLGIAASIRTMYITLKPLLKGEREKKDEAYEKSFEERYPKS